MNDDWRIGATLTSNARATELGKLLGGGGFEHDLATTAGERVIVSVDERRVFLYTDGREQAERAAAAVAKLATERGWEITTELRRWHPTAEEWEDPNVPLPATDADVAREHAELIAEERAESSRFGFAEYEVRVQCASHHDALALARRLRSEAIPYLRRWHYVLIGAADEDSAAALAKRIAAEIPAGSTVTVEASGAAAYQDAPANPFAVFGGLGG